MANLVTLPKIALYRKQFFGALASNCFPPFCFILLICAFASRRYRLFSTMNTSEEPRAARRSFLSSISPEALMGIGITIAELGVLGLLLGWAQYMRSVPGIAMIWLPLGALLLVIGALMALAARKSRGR